jgi:hypothetical protein
MINKALMMNLCYKSLLGFAVLLWTFDSSAQTCVPPGMPILNELLDESVVISWEAGGDELSWDIDYGLTPHTPNEFGPFQNEQVIDNSEFSLLGFLPKESYDLYVRAECTVNPDFPEYSEWVGPLTFTTFPDVCQNSVNLLECQRQQLQFGFDSEQYPISCTGLEEGRNWIIEFAPLQAQEYFLHSDNALNSIMIRKKDVCNDLNWQCIFDGSMENYFSLGNLEMNMTYQILVRAEGTPQVLIGQCESILFENYELDSFDADLTTTNLEFISDGSPIEGNFDLFLIQEGMIAPLPNSLPTFSSFSIVDGLVSFPTNQLIFDADYDMYIRPDCPQVNACWNGPFNFETPINCGEAPEFLNVDANSINADLTIGGESGQSWRIEIGEAPFSEPDPLAPGTFNLLSSFSNGQSIKYTLLDLQPLTTYQYYLKRDCSNSSVVIGNQPWYGPYEFTTNSDCFIEVQDLNCGQCYASRPAYGHDYFEANFFCGNNDAPSRGERIFRIQRPSSGQVTLSRNISSVEPFETIIYQLYLKSANEVCDLNDWEHLGCWVSGTGGVGDIVIDVEADSVYHLMIDYQTESTVNYNYIRFEFFAEDCENECQPIQNLDFAPINEENVMLSWDPLPGAIGYDIVSVPVGQSPNPNPCLYQYSSLFDAILHPDTFYLISDLSLNEPRDIYVRSRCSELNYSPWTMVEIESLEGQSMQYSNMGTLQYCSPSYSLNGNSVLYDQLTFNVAEDGWYQLHQIIQGSNYLSLYESNFDPDQPSQNLLASEKDDFPIVDEVTLWYDLESEKDYIVVCSAQPGVAPSENIELTISGKGMISSLGFEYFGIADGPSGTVPNTNGTNYISNQVCTDAIGWRHYYQTDGTGINLDNDALLFSVKEYPEINNQVGMDTLTISGEAGTSLISNTAENYVMQPDGWITMNRFWDLILADDQQPTSPIAVRFYYTEEDFQAMTDALPLDSIINHNDLAFYKINQSAIGYNSNPADGHLDIPLADYCADEGYWEYSFATQADTSSWSYGMHKEAHFAEMLVHEFSGGGGGIGSAIDFTNDIDENYFEEKKWTVFPNPIHNEVFIGLQNGKASPELIQCFNMNGQMVHVEAEKIGSEILFLNTALWPSGIYFVKMANFEGFQIEKIIKP